MSSISVTFKKIVNSIPGDSPSLKDDESYICTLVDYTQQARFPKILTKITNYT